MYPRCFPGHGHTLATLKSYHSKTRGQITKIFIVISAGYTYLIVP